MSTAAERKRRSRAHLKGDHSLCDPERCDGSDAVTGEGPVTVSEPSQASKGVTEPVSEPGEIEVEVQALVDELKFAEGDPRRILGRIAVKLARHVDATDASPAAIRELRVLLAQISEVPDGPAGPLDATRARRATRRINTMLVTHR